MSTLDNQLVVALPNTTTLAAARDIAESIEKATNRSVLVVTHNVEFLLAVEVEDQEEAGQLVDRIVGATEDVQ